MAIAEILAEQGLIRNALVFAFMPGTEAWTKGCRQEITCCITA